jgi:hypothetical protein
VCEGWSFVWFRSSEMTRKERSRKEIRCDLGRSRKRLPALRSGKMNLDGLTRPSYSVGRLCTNSRGKAMSTVIPAWNRCVCRKQTPYGGTTDGTSARQLRPLIAYAAAYFLPRKTFGGTERIWSNNSVNTHN